MACVIDAYARANGWTSDDPVRDLRVMIPGKGHAILDEPAVVNGVAEAARP